MTDGEPIGKKTDGKPIEVDWDDYPDLKYYEVAWGINLTWEIKEGY